MTPVDLKIRSFYPVSVGRVIHGIGARFQVPVVLDELHLSKAIIVSCQSIIDGTEIVRDVAAKLGGRFAGLAPAVPAHTPTVAVKEVIEFGQQMSADAIIAIGGSSVTDAAKWAALALAGGEPAVVVENGSVARNSNTEERPLPLLTIPTTLSAGDFHGAAAMVDATTGIKTLAMDDRFLPWAVCLDPEATLSTPAKLWTSSGIKALDHAAETIWGNNSHPVGDALAAAALKRLSIGLRRCHKNPADLDARLECQIGSWMSISSMKNTLIHISHAIEHTMGSYWGLDHGITSCIVLPAAMAFMADEAPDRVTMVAKAMGWPGSPGASASKIALEASERLARWIGDLGLPTRLRDVMSTSEDLPIVAEIATKELAFFGYVPTGVQHAVRRLLEQMC